MFDWIQQWREQRILSRSSMTHEQWQHMIHRLPLLKGLTADELNKLTRLATLFIHDKAFEGARDFAVTQAMKMLIALQACLPILNLGLQAYRGWYSVILYPSGFAPERVYIDEYGIEHHERVNLSGESWHKGPVILAWDEAEHAGIIDGHNLVVHEFAHKLDIQTGDANGCPPMHKDMSGKDWFDAMSKGYDDLCQHCEHGTSVGIDCYAATSPAEFFAVISEVFFERPDVIVKRYPQIYTQLTLYYRQDPLARLT